MTFDARAAKLLQPGQHLISSEHPGLRLVVTADRRTWIYRYRSPIDGRVKQIKIGAWPAMSTSSAIVKWESLKDLRDGGQDPSAEIRESRQVKKQEAQAKKVKAVTVQDICDFYADYLDQVRAKKGAVEARRMFDKMLGKLAMVPAAEVTRSQAFDLIKSFTDSAPVQAKKLRAELGAAWDYAIDAGRLVETSPNWWRLILRGKIQSKGRAIDGVKVGTVKRVLSSEETGELIRWLPNFTPLLYDVLTVYLWTATRGAEIVSMEGSEVSQDADDLWWWVIPKAKTKNARHKAATDLRVPLFGRALEVILRRKKVFGCGYLFPANVQGIPQPIQQKTIQSGVFFYQPYSKVRPQLQRPRLTVSHWSPHDLRRTSRTMLAALGCPDSVGESILGHMLPGVLGIYNQHAYDQERVIWLRRLSEHLEQLATGSVAS